MVQSLSAAQRSKVRRASQPQELAPEDEGGELNIIPFLDIIVNILIFVLATVAVTFTTSIATTPPSTGGSGVRQDKDKQALNLSALVVNDGIALKASGGNVAPGCNGLGGGLAVPKRGGEHDFAELTRCAEKLKKSNPDFEEETQISITANNDVDYQTIVRVMDAVRETPEGKLFSDVNFALQR